MNHSIITSLIDLAQLAHVQGKVNPNAPTDAIAILGTCVQVGVPVMVIQDTNAWRTPMDTR
jgi:SH3-like domain-containing protein